MCDGLGDGDGSAPGLSRRRGHLAAKWPPGRQPPKAGWQDRAALLVPVVPAAPECRRHRLLGAAGTARIYQKCVRKNLLVLRLRAGSTRFSMRAPSSFNDAGAINMNGRTTLRIQRARRDADAETSGVPCEKHAHEYRCRTCTRTPTRDGHRCRRDCGP